MNRKGRLCRNTASFHRNKYLLNGVGSQIVPMKRRRRLPALFYTSAPREYQPLHKSLSQMGVSVSTRAARRQCCHRRRRIGAFGFLGGRLTVRLDRLVRVINLICRQIEFHRLGYHNVFHGFEFLVLRHLKFYCGIHPRGFGRRCLVWVAKKPDIIGLFAGDIFFVPTLWRSERDLNSRVLFRHLLP